MIPRGLEDRDAVDGGVPGACTRPAPRRRSRSPIALGLLRDTLKFGGVSITDALGTPTGHDEVTAGRIAAGAGADVLLYTDSAPGELPALQRALTNGAIKRADARASYRRIVALKRRVASG